MTVAGDEALYGTLQPWPVLARWAFSSSFLERKEALEHARVHAIAHLRELGVQVERGELKNGLNRAAQRGLISSMEFASALWALMVRNDLVYKKRARTADEVAEAVVIFARTCGKTIVVTGTHYAPLGLTPTRIDELTTEYRDLLETAALVALAPLAIRAAGKTVEAGFEVVGGFFDAISRIFTVFMVIVIVIAVIALIAQHP